MRQRLIQNYIRPLLIAFMLIVFAAPELLHAQMFSVAEGRERYDRSFNYSSLTVGWQPAEFTFTGNPEAAGNDRFDFNEGLFRFHFENPGINLHMGLAGRLTGASENTILNIGAEIYNNFLLTGNERLQLFLPLQLKTDLLRVQAAAASNQFQQTAFQIGSGLGVNSSLGDRINLTAQLTPHIGFSNSQGAFVGGTLFTWEGKARLYLDNLFGGSGLVVGYDFQNRSYTIDEDLFDYDLTAHTLTLGITF